MNTGVVLSMSECVCVSTVLVCVCLCVYVCDLGSQHWCQKIEPATVSIDTPHIDPPFCSPQTSPLHSSNALDPALPNPLLFCSHTEAATC